MDRVPRWYELNLYDNGPAFENAIAGSPAMQRW